jgi:hypothetical protein
MPEEENTTPAEINPDALEAALGDDVVEGDEELLQIHLTTPEDDLEVDIAFTHDDPRDWY